MTTEADSMSQEEQVVWFMLTNVKHCAVLDMQMISASRGKVTLCLHYSDRIIGNPDNGVIHGGALTTLMDTACGAASVVALEDVQICPTLDLRIDYMTAATPGKDIYGMAEVYRVARQVIFTRGIAFHEGEEDKPIAHCVSTFMRLDPANIQHNTALQVDNPFTG